MSFLNEGPLDLMLDGNQGPHNNSRSREISQLENENKRNEYMKKIMVLVKTSSTCYQNPITPSNMSAISVERIRRNEIEADG